MVGAPRKRRTARYRHGVAAPAGRPAGASLCLPRVSGAALSRLRRFAIRGFPLEESSTRRMKQITQDFRSGKLALQDVPAPGGRDGGVLVQNSFSLISAGTERMAMDLAKKSLLGKARERPDLVRQLVLKARAEGIPAAIQKATSRLDVPAPLGYSCSGVVLESSCANLAPGR